MNTFRRSLAASVLGIDNSAIGQPEFREHRANDGLVFRLAKDATEVLDAKICPPLCERPIPTGEKKRAAFRACGSATFRNFARSAHFYEQGKPPLLSAINNLDERVDVVLRWHEHCSKRGR